MAEEWKKPTKRLTGPERQIFIGNGRAEQSQRRISRTVPAEICPATQFSSVFHGESLAPVLPDESFRISGGGGHAGGVPLFSSKLEQSKHRLNCNYSTAERVARNFSFKFI